MNSCGSIESSNENNNQIIDTNNLTLICDNFKKTNQELKEKHEIITKTIERYTSEEVKAVENAINNLNKKISKVMECSKMKEYTEETTKLQQKMYSSLQKVMIVFEKYRQQIMRDTTISREAKLKKITLCFNKLQDRLFTTEEIEEFKNKFNQVIALFPKRTSYKSIKHNNNVTL